MMTPERAEALRQKIAEELAAEHDAEIHRLDNGDIDVVAGETLVRSVLTTRAGKIGAGENLWLVTEYGCEDGVMFAMTVWLDENTNADVSLS